MPKELIKVQRRLDYATNECLIYNENKSIMFNQEFSALDMAIIFPSDELKVYFDADFDGQTFGLGVRVDDQDW